MDALLICTTVHVQCTSDIHCIHGHPEIFNGCLVGLHYCTCTLYFGYTMDIQRYSMDALLVCTTVHVHVLQIYIVSMDIQRCSMDALLVCTTVHVHVHVLRISRDVQWMPCWFALLYMYMYFGYTLYPWISRDILWMPP